MVMLIYRVTEILESFRRLYALSFTALTSPPFNNLSTDSARTVILKVLVAVCLDSFFIFFSFFHFVLWINLVIVSLFYNF